VNAEAGTHRPPPGSLGAPLVGEALAFRRDPFAFTLSRTRQHGHVWKTRILRDTVVFFAGPEAFSFFMDPENFTRQGASPSSIQRLLHREAVPFLDGEAHRTRKRLLLAAFTDQAMAGYLPGLFAVIRRFVEAWIVQGEKPLVGDLDQLGFDLADVLFAAADPGTSNVEGAKDFARLNKGPFAVPINLPFTEYGQAIRARDRLRVYLRQRVSQEGGGSALGVLKAACGPHGERLSVAQLEFELLHFFFAAHSGVTAAFAWMFTVLGERPQLAARFRAEADAVLAPDRAPDLAEVRALALARSASREVLRCYPFAPVTFFGVARKELEFHGYSIRAGSKGAGAIWATLHDRTTFADPEAYDPDRLDDDAVGALAPGAFVPQGGGARDGHRCGGEALVQLLMPAFFGWFTRNYDLVYPAQDASPGGRRLPPLPKGGVRVRITRRASDAIGALRGTGP
jgi:retinoid hydroxylase